MTESPSSASSRTGDAGAVAASNESRTGSPRRSPQFQTTRWSVIAEAADDSGPQQRAALADLCRAYWQPVYGFIRRSGLAPEAAEDLTQDFFAELLDRGPLIKLADPKRGKFRTFMLAAVKHRIANYWRDQGTLKRGGGTVTFSINAQNAETRYASEPVDGWTPEALFNRRWALTLLENVLDRLAQDYANAGKAEWFESMRPFLTTDERPAYEELADRLHTTSAAVRVAVHRLRKQYREALSEEISVTLGDESLVADERSELLKAVAGH